MSAAVRSGRLLARTAHAPSPITRGALQTYSEPTLQAATVTTQGAHCVYKGFRLRVLPPRLLPFPIRFSFNTTSQGGAPATTALARVCRSARVKGYTLVYDYVHVCRHAVCCIDAVQTLSRCSATGYALATPRPAQLSVLER